jgi:bifunctional DNase/RNase
MIEVVIDSIRVSLMSQQRIVILRERNADRYLPIWIGIYEAESITIALQEMEVARPLTHDLMRNIFSELGARVIRVEVVALKDDTFFGRLVVEANGRTLHIDSRPSDALAIAVRAHVPVLVAAEVMDAAAVSPDEDLSETSSPSSKPSTERRRSSAAPAPASDSSEENLSVFEDFLSGLNLDAADDDPDEDGPAADEDPDAGDRR